MTATHPLTLSYGGFFIKSNIKSMSQQNKKELEEMTKQVREIHRLFFGELPKKSTQDLNDRLKADILMGSKKHRNKGRT